MTCSVIRRIGLSGSTDGVNYSNPISMVVNGELSLQASISVGPPGDGCDGELSFEWSNGENSGDVGVSQEVTVQNSVSALSTAPFVPTEAGTYVLHAILDYQGTIFEGELAVTVSGLGG